jgi:tetratricopeptide (TPR) repeat protein
MPRGDCRYSLARLLLIATLLIIPANAHADLTCTDNALPLETDGQAPKKEEPQILNDQALICERQGKHLTADVLFSESIKLDPKNAVTYLDRGGARIALGEVELAMSDFNTAIMLRPELAEAWYYRGATLANLDQYDRALGDLSEAIRLKPDFALAYCGRGVVKFHTNQINEALLDFIAGIDRDPKLASCYLDRGTLYLLVRGDYKKALDDLTEALTLSPANATILARRGEAYEGLGQFDHALEDFQAALQLNQNLKSAKEGVWRLSRGSDESKADATKN